MSITGDSTNIGDGKPSVFGAVQSCRTYCLCSRRDFSASTRFTADTLKTSKVLQRQKKRGITVRGIGDVFESEIHQVRRERQGCFDTNRRDSNGSPVRE